MADNKDLQQVWGLLMKGAVILALISACLGGCGYLNFKAGLDNDHILEELIEDQVEFHLGLPEDSVDLTPGD